MTIIYKNIYELEAIDWYLELWSFDTFFNAPANEGCMFVINDVVMHELSLKCVMFAINEIKRRIYDEEFTGETNTTDSTPN